VAVNGERARQTPLKEVGPEKAKSRSLAALGMTSFLFEIEHHYFLWQLRRENTNTGR
jgi:hypothetical protein